MNQRKIMLVGNGAYSNRGCEAIVRGTLAILERSFPEAHIENWVFSQHYDAVPTEFPADDPLQKIKHMRMPVPVPAKRLSWPWAAANLSRRMGIGPHDFIYAGYHQFQQQLYDLIQSADVALQVGGDNYSLDYGVPWTHTSVDVAMARKGIPVVLWGASVGPFAQNPRVEKWMLEHLRRYINLVLAREQKTIQYLREKGLEEHVCSMGDPAFVMEAQIPPADLYTHKVPDNAIGLNLSPLLAGFRNASGDMEQWIKDAAGLMDALRRGIDRPLILIPHVVQPGNSDYDFMLAAVQAARLEEGGYYLVPPTLNAPQLKWIISHLDVLIAARTHATISGFSSCIPTISIAYSVKAKGLNELLFGSQGLVIPIRELDAGQLLTTTQLVLEQADDIRERLVQVVPTVEQAAFDGGEILRRFLDEI